MSHFYSLEQHVSDGRCLSCLRLHWNVAITWTFFVERWELPSALKLLSLVNLELEATTETMASKDDGLEEVDMDSNTAITQYVIYNFESKKYSNIFTSLS